MTTMTMPTTAERTQTSNPKRESQFPPMLVATVLLVATGVISVLLSGPMH